MRKKIVKNNQNINELSMGFAFDMVGSGVFDDLRELIKTDKEFLYKDTNEQLNRIGDFLKMKTGVIFRSEDFVNWFYRKLKLKQQGENLPVIKDDDLIEYALEYHKILEEKFTAVIGKNFLKLNYGSNNEKVLDLLYKELHPRLIESSKEDFIAHFKDSASSSI
ncbi:hypothetical protein [Chryseobacterium wangxinyae]|uniref:hypothetical protein n=1 Tax=Chryseobacterium sp. CY353 TaxID=2997334 RepID=UPI00226D9353|nr:hypothetical protein [Chryseobacterium sp. CY353]MCY0971045.1 hypothetical protein [Chryseobacterium sp. CY353]